MNKRQAEEYTQSLGQIFTGGWRQIVLADNLGVPKALGLTLDQWVKQRIGGYVKLSVDERREAVKELTQNGKSQREAARVLGVDEGTVRGDLGRRAENSAQLQETPLDNAPENGSSAENSAPSKTPSEKAADLRQTHEAGMKALFEKPAEAPNGEAIQLGDFYELSLDLKDNSVDLIFTDPPYDTDSIPLFGRMGEVAARILKPGGSLITYLGHLQLIEGGAALSKHLRFWHPLCCLHAGPYARMTEYGVVEAFKPMLWFVKGTRSDKLTFIESVVTGAREKDHHEWQQAESEAAYFIEKLSAANGLVVDFFAGGGTTIVVARRLGRHAVGYEINKRHWQKANQRLK